MEWKTYVTLGKSVDHSITAMRQYANEKKLNLEFLIYITRLHYANNPMPCRTMFFLSRIQLDREVVTSATIRIRNEILRKMRRGRLVKLLQHG